MAKEKRELVQYAALPYMVRDGRPQVMLITSRETRRWILPKGKPEKGLKPHEAAAREAFEEAGVVGRAMAKRYDSFKSFKRLKSGKELPCVVEAYLLAVEQELDDWPEKGQRQRGWFTPGEAALLVSEPGLVQLLLEFGSLTIWDGDGPDGV